MHKALDQATEKMETLPTNANVEAHSKVKAQYTRARTQATKNSWHEKTASLNMEKDTTGLWNLTRALNNDNPSKSKIVIEANNELIAENELQILLLLQRSTAVQVRSSVRLMPQNQPFGRGLLPSTTAWSPDQHHAAMLTDLSWYILGRTEGCGLGFGRLVSTHKGKCLKCQSSSDGHSNHNALCAGGR